MTIDHAIARIRAYRHAQGWSLYGFANAAGLRESTIRHIDSDGWSPTANTLRKLEAVIPADFAGPPPDGSQP